MRISDWRFNVCSSDLIAGIVQPLARALRILVVVERADHHAMQIAASALADDDASETVTNQLVAHRQRIDRIGIRGNLQPATWRAGRHHGLVRDRLDHRLWRSDEHTSELQLLMRHSYAVFCLTKQSTTRTNANRTRPQMRI